uniref:Uncharacterized protein n=1 Tax=Strongyloides papillosus TaxID=174720 RepID=A0A0N5C692_STREA
MESLILKSEVGNDHLWRFYNIEKTGTKVVNCLNIYKNDETNLLVEWKHEISSSAPILRERNSQEVSHSEPNNNLRKKGRESNFSIVDDELDDIQRRGSFSASETIYNSETTSLISGTTGTQDSTSTLQDKTDTQKKSFLKRLKSFCKINQKQIEVHCEYVFGFRTERTQQGIWLLKENQSDFINPQGRMFTKK